VAERLAVRDVAARDLDACARLLAGRHRRDRARLPILPAAFDQPGECAGVLGELLADEAASGAVAERGGEVVGFMFGRRALHAPDHWLAQYFPPRSIGIPIHGHAAAEGVDTLATYRGLYGHLAGRWVDGGFFTHRADFLASDAEQRDAWFQLGFGAVTTYAGRDARPLDVTVTLGEGIEVRRGTVEDLAEVERLESVNGRFHHGSPVFWPYLWEDVRASASGLSKYALGTERHAIFLATRGAPRTGGTETLGMQMLFAGMAFGPRLVTPEGWAYLFHGVVDPERRGGGVGTALLERSLDWARANSHGSDRDAGIPGGGITLHYATMNPLAGPFWGARGFEPIAYSAERTVDRRVAWARPRGSSEG
jgi:GNAT superfamily N-acetyltransferase